MNDALKLFTGSGTPELSIESFEMQVKWKGLAYLTKRSGSFLANSFLGERDEYLAPPVSKLLLCSSFK